MKGSILVVWIAIAIGDVRAEAQKCVGTIGFSSHGAEIVHQTGLIKYKTDHFNNGYNGWDRGTGAFTVVCPGIYQVSYAGYGDAMTRLTLKKRSDARTSQWQELVTTRLGGGSVSVVVPLNVGEQVAIVVSGRLQIDPNETPFTYFNALRIGV